MKHHTAAARRSRKLPTDAEQRLWSRLRHEQLGVAFRRQHPVRGYIVDFYAAAVKLAVEVDGGQHATAGLREELRTKALTSRGITVLRFWNNEVLGNTEGVLRAIQTVLVLLAPQTPSLSLLRGLPGPTGARVPCEALPGGGDASGALALQDLNLTLAENHR
jgi:very-short-patch-repair endonuclease